MDSLRLLSVNTAILFDLTSAKRVGEAFIRLGTMYLTAIYRFSDNSSIITDEVD